MTCGFGEFVPSYDGLLIPFRSSVCELEHNSVQLNELSTISAAVKSKFAVEKCALRSAETCQR